ncbi:MAG: hypothetical protein WD069_02075 [Planctomycetales bacterium]
MQNSVTKLAVIAGVIGVMLLALLQALRGMNGDANPAATASPAAQQAPLGESRSPADFPELADEPVPPGQTEPDDFETVLPARPAAPAALTDSQVEGLPLASRNAPVADVAGTRAAAGVRPASPPTGRRSPFEDDDFFRDGPGDSFAAEPRGAADESPAAVPVSAAAPAPRAIATNDDDEAAPLRRNSAVPAGFPVPSEAEEAPAAPPAAPFEPRPLVPRPAPAFDESDADHSAPFPPREPRPLFTNEPEPVAPPRIDRDGGVPADPFEDLPADRPAVELSPGPASSPAFPGPDAAPKPATPPAPSGSAGPLRSLPKLPIPDDSAANRDETDAGAPSLREPVEPARLTPSADTAPLAPLAAGEMLGDATVAADAPSGPQRPQVTLEKIAPETALLGQPLVYSIVVRNAGDSPASDVVVEDRIPAGTKLTGTIPRAELLDKRLIWRLGTLDPGDEKKISVRVMPLAEGEIGSVATVNFVAEVASRTKITSARLKLAVEAPPAARVGEPVVFRFSLTNAGEADATNVVLRDMIPDGLSHSSGDDLEYAVGTVAAGETKQVQLTLTAARPGRTVNRAIVTADGNLSVEGSAALDVAAPALAVARTGPARQFVGREAVFTNAVTNESDRPIRGATVTETVPEGYEFLEASHGGQYHAGTRTIAWTIDTLGPKQSAVLKVKLRPAGAGTLESVVEVTDESGGRSRAVSQTAVVGFAALGLDLNSERTPALVGDEVPLTVLVHNEGTSNATRVGVTLDVPQELELVSAEGPTKYRQEGSRVVFEPIPELGSAAPATIQAVFRAARPGDARIRVAIQADQMQRPLVREEAALVLEATP